MAGQFSAPTLSASSGRRDLFESLSPIGEKGRVRGQTTSNSHDWRVHPLTADAPEEGAHLAIEDVGALEVGRVAGSAHALEPRARHVRVYLLPQLRPAEPV